MPCYYGGGYGPRTIPKKHPQVSSLMSRLLKRRTA